MCTVMNDGTALTLLEFFCIFFLLQFFLNLSQCLKNAGYFCNEKLRINLSIIAINVFKKCNRENFNLSS